MYDTDDRIWSSIKVNHGGFIKFHKRLVRFFVATLIILAGITNESKGIKPSSSLPVIKLQQYSLNRAQSLSLPKIRRQDCILNITTECFKIRNQKDCGNVLLYRVKSLRLDGKHSCPVTLQSGLGSASAKQLAEKTKEIRAISPLVLSGLDVVLAIHMNALNIINDSIYMATYVDSNLQNVVNGLETDMNWNPSDAVVLYILEALLKYGSLLNDINWGQQKSAISNQINKNNWLNLLTFLINTKSDKALNASKNLIAAMVRGIGIKLRNPAILNGLVNQLKTVDGLHMEENDIKQAVLWGRYSLHTEPQVEALKIAGDINVISMNLNVQKKIEVDGDCYSLYNPCPSCQGLNWIILRKGSSDKRFLFCLGDKSYGVANENWPEDFQTF